jgi:hypothetical protein
MFVVPDDYDAAFPSFPQHVVNPQALQRTDRAS